jgi:hypothetical protein
MKTRVTWKSVTVILPVLPLITGCGRATARLSQRLPPPENLP